MPVVTCSYIRCGGQGDGGSRVDQVAVYGTLRLERVRRDLGLAELVAPGGRCLLPGRLYDLGAYPGLVLDGDGGVVAERFTVLDEAAMARLDRYEGYDTHDPEGSLFRRVVLDCLDPPVPVWCYLYNRALADAPLIASGDWLA